VRWRTSSNRAKFLAVDCPGDVFRRVLPARQRLARMVVPSSSVPAWPPFAPTVPCGPACLAGGRGGSSAGPGIDLRWTCDIPLMDLGSPDAAAGVAARLRPGHPITPSRQNLDRPSQTADPVRWVTGSARQHPRPTVTTRGRRWSRTPYAGPLTARRPAGITLCITIGRSLNGRAGPARATRSGLTSKRGANMAPKRPSRDNPELT
jgi:hypothetical protein